MSGRIEINSGPIFDSWQAAMGAATEAAEYLAKSAWPIMVTIHPVTGLLGSYTGKYQFVAISGCDPCAEEGDNDE